MNNSQPSAGGGGMMTMIIVIVLLIVIGVGGYFGYTKWWVPKQCNDKGPDTTSNVASFIWDSESGTCMENVCADGFGNAATGGSPPCTAYTSASKYTQLTGACRSAGTGLYVSTDFDQTITGAGAPNRYTNLELSDCKAKCDASSTCTAISYPLNKDCYLFINPTVKTSTDSGTSAGELCYKKNK